MYPAGGPPTYFQSQYAHGGGSGRIRELESLLESERRARCAAEEQSARLQAKLASQEVEIAQLRSRLAQAGTRESYSQQDYLSVKPWLQQPWESHANVVAAQQQQDHRSSGIASQLYVTQNSSPPAQPPPPMIGSLPMSAVTASHLPRFMSEIFLCLSQILSALIRKDHRRSDHFCDACRISLCF